MVAKSLAAHFKDHEIYNLEVCAIIRQESVYSFFFEYSCQFRTFLQMVNLFILTRQPCVFFKLAKRFKLIVAMVFRFILSFYLEPIYRRLHHTAPSCIILHHVASMHHTALTSCCIMLQSLSFFVSGFS